MTIGATGGTNNAGLFTTMYLYLTGFRFLKFGYASAEAVIMFLINMALVVAYVRLLGGGREGAR